jgi:hypothetical protein
MRLDRWRNAIALQFLNESSGKTQCDGFVKNNSAAAADESVDGWCLTDKNSPL